jgi:hypothetical protein
MEQNTMVFIRMVRKMALVSLYGLMALPMKETSSITTSMGMECTLGQIKGNSRVSGSTIKCMGRVSSPGQMAEYTRENTNMIRRRVSGSLHGLTVVSMKDSG